MSRCIDKIENVFFAGAREIQDAEAFASLTEEAFGNKPLFIQEISTVIALNAGKDTLALALMKE